MASDALGRYIRILHTRPTYASYIRILHVRILHVHPDGVHCVGQEVLVGMHACTHVRMSHVRMCSCMHVCCVGQEVLVGMRRRLTCVAHTNVESLIIERSALTKLFKQGDSADLRHMCTFVFRHFMGRERLRNFGTALHR